MLSVARWHPIKDHRTFLAALAELLKRESEIVAVLCGPGVDESNEQLQDQIQLLGLRNHVKLLGARDGLEDYYSLAEVYVLHSQGEAFPNTLIEAMSCGTLVVSTKVGEVPSLLPDLDLVEPGDYQHLASAISTQMNLEPDDRFELRRIYRQRIIDNFSIKSVIDNYERLLIYQSTRKYRNTEPDDL